MVPFLGSKSPLLYYSPTFALNAQIMRHFEKRLRSQIDRTLTQLIIPVTQVWSDNRDGHLLP